ncbi:MAG TPA: DNA-3-methyladenine glycosylase [Gemmatimonadaceae bacterium]|nr:DNA-3-methyladenine glycosylase [Gemmatimonadaceae bacterium]
MTRNAAHLARRSRLGAPLPVKFYDRPTELVARDLLGAVLECAAPDGVTRGRIVETEAYTGPEDPACHAAAGLTRRTRHLFGPPGVAYVYLIYGMYWCFNAVTREVGHGAAVLVRAVAPLDGIELMRARRPKVTRDRDLTNGPGKLCLAMGIDGAMDGTSLRDGPITIRAGEPVPDDDVVVTPRIGIVKAAEWPLRYFVRDDPFVSKTPAHFERGRWEGR